MKHILVFASGDGSNFEAIVGHFLDKNVSVELLCDKPNAPVLARAKRLGIKFYIVKFEDTRDFLKNKKYNLFVLAGYMRILPQEVLDLGTFINIHPSLLPYFKGLDAIRRAYDAKVSTTGVSVHYVNNEVDCGKIIAQSGVKIEEKMTFEELENKIHVVEHALYSKVVEGLLK